MNQLKGVLVLDNGDVYTGFMPFEGKAVGEICFNTGMTGYQESITDPSYINQIITFTFPYIGNTGFNYEDIECGEKSSASGIIVRNKITEDSNFRSKGSFIDFAKSKNIPILYGVDTRDITFKIRSKLVNNCIISSIKSNDEIKLLLDEVKSIPSMNGMDCTSLASTKKEYIYANETAEKTVVVIDYGVKENILKMFASFGLKVVVLPYHSSFDEIMKHKPNGVFLSNGPGDPRETIKHTERTILAVAKKKIPIFGICLGHQIIAGIFGAKLIKLPQGHRGVNQPVINYQTNQIEITPQNHGFACDENSIPNHIEITHRSLFDGVIEGIRVQEGINFKTKEGEVFEIGKIFSVQYHPEGSGGPHDSVYLFKQFILYL
jgi:carbamoyl-phosphate synthase small subunit